LSMGRVLHVGRVEALGVKKAYVRHVGRHPVPSLQLAPQPRLLPRKPYEVVVKTGKSMFAKDEKTLASTPSWKIPAYKVMYVARLYRRKDSIDMSINLKVAQSGEDIENWARQKAIRQVQRRVRLERGGQRLLHDV
jgi:hypothetical protein